MSDDTRQTVKLPPETPEERARMMAAIQGGSRADAKAPVEAKAAAEPLPIWFFVGLILLVYGLIITVSGLVMAPRPTVLAELRPSLWWGGIMCVGGAVFLGLGLKGRRAP